MSTEDPSSQPVEATRASNSLSSEDAARLTLAISHMTSLGLPLASGLRALAEETPGSSLALALNQLADQIAQGAPFDQAIGRLEHQFPPHLRGLISVGMRTDTLGETLADFAARERAMRARRRRVRQALAYPVILFLCSLPILLFMIFFLMPQMSIVYEDFGLQLPDVTVHVFRAIHEGAQVTGVLLILLTILLITSRWLLRFQLFDRIYSSIPLVGPAFVWSRVANFSQILGTLVEHHVPLPEALQYTAAAVPGQGLQTEARRLADSVSSGRSLSKSLAEGEMFPPLLTAFIKCGEHAGRLPNALEAAGRFAALQTDRQAERIRLVLPLIVFTSVLFLEGSLYIAMLAPMVGLIRALTY